MKKLTDVIKERIKELDKKYKPSAYSLIGYVACELSEYDFEDVCKVLEDIKDGNIDSYIE